jgi:glycosyltransferase involved in cell wall biosynthesis
MKTIFFHDHIITRKEGILYSTGGLNKKVINRYIKIFNNFSLGTRSNSDRDIDKLSVIGSSEIIKFVPIPNLATLNIRNYRTAIRIIQEEIIKNNVIIVRLPSIIGFVATYYAKSKGKILITELVGCPWDSYSNYSLKGYVIAGPFYLLTKYFIRNSTNVLYVTKNFLQKKYPTKAQNIIDCSDVELEVAKEVLKIRLKKNKSIDNPLILGMIGSLEAPYKGFDTALKAISKLETESSRQIILEIVGGGNPATVEKLIAKLGLGNNVAIKGSLPYPDGIFNWLDNVDIFLQPSRVEGLPRALVEAMSRGCACIGSEVGGIPELIPTGFLIKKNDSNKLAELILKLKDEKTRKEHSILCFNKAIEYDKSILDKKRNEFYQKCISN